MAGKSCDGTINLHKCRESTAYCEGYRARAASASPTNPHAAGTDDADAWDRGVAAKVGEGVADEDRGCCAPAGAAAV